VSYRAIWGESTRTISSADEAEELLDDLSRDYGPDGTRGIVVSFGPTDGPMELEVAINTDEGRAAISWLRSREYAVEAGIPRHPRTVPAWAFREGDTLSQRHLPPDQTRVTPGRALAAVREYLDSGRRPNHLAWTAA